MMGWARSRQAAEPSKPLTSPIAAVPMVRYAALGTLWLFQALPPTSLGARGPRFSGRGVEPTKIQC
jgi:hypothetical protein